MTFLSIGHRGLMGVEPENTLRSFVRAEREGVDLIELDLHLSKDGALVVMHDAEVDRTTDGSGAIADHTLAELRELDAGEGERVPVFEEVLRTVSGPLQAEIKDVAAAETLAGVLRARDLLDRVEVISFHDDALAAIRALLPQARTALVASRFGTDVVDRARAVGAARLSLNVRRVTCEIVERAHAADLSVIGWTVNTAERLTMIRAMGLDGAVTDQPAIHHAVRSAA